MAKKHRSKKGLLIKGSFDKIPVEVIEDEAFRKKLRELMKGWSGIYALYSKDKLYYVGLATSSFWRLWNHFKKDRHKGKWDKFSLFRIKRVGYLKDLETLILQISKPKGNKVVGKIPRDLEITSIIRSLISDHRKTAEKIEKALR